MTATKLATIIPILAVPIAIIGVHGRDLHGADEALELASMREYEEMLLDYLWS